jgi:RimJ/RimL family protein N-acetyltransferase
MEYILATKRLFLREIGQQDVEDLYEMDADPAVHKYIENKPVQSREQVVAVIDMINEQYKVNGIGRWAVVDKETKECVGWAGLKYYREEDYYDLGYRFKQRHWKKGYATEVGEVIVQYGFEQMDLSAIYAITHPENEGSMNVLRKLGFELMRQSEDENWFELKRK